MSKLVVAPDWAAWEAPPDSGPGINDNNRVSATTAAVATGRFATDYETVYDGVVGPWFLEMFVRSSHPN